MMFDDLRARVSSSVVLLGFVLGTLTFGVWGIKVLTIVVSIGMVYEWLRIVGYTRRSLFFVLTASIFIPVLIVSFREPVLALGVLFLIVSSFIFLREVYGMSLLKVALGALIIGMLVLSVFSCLALCQNGFFMIAWVALIVISMDVGGYFWGSWIGGPKLVPKLSPKKTWSGFIGGLLSAIFVSVLTYAYYFEATLPASLLWRIVFLGTMSALGDLMESWLKRAHGFKNSGRIIPGHGGVLDRFDGYLFAMPGLYLLIYFDRYFMVSFGEFEKVL